MKEFKNLGANEKSMLMKFPAYISLLAANSDGTMDKTEKEEAIKFTHIKTFSCTPLLAPYYKEAEKMFLTNIEELDNLLPKERTQRELAIKKELPKLEPILKKLGNDYASAMHTSMKSYTKHVSKAHNNVLEAFLIPFYIKGLTA
jgi:hypothetical protein